MDTFQTEEAEKDYHKLVALRSELYSNLKELLAYIRLNYLEVDVDETSKNAFEEYKEAFEKESL